MTKMTDSYKLSVFEHGVGKPLVLLHGLISTHRYWNQVVELMDQDSWKFISPDLLGFGDSPKPKEGPYDLSQQVACVDESITSIAKPPYRLVGHSMGAITALKWAVDKPDLFNGLVLTSLPLLRSESQYRQLATIVETKLFSRERIAKVGVHSLNWLNVIPARMLKLQKIWPTHIVEDWKKHSRKAYRKIMQNAVFADQILALLAEVKVPTHVLIGSRDGMIGQSGIEQLQNVVKVNKKLSLEIVSSAHNLPLEHPEIVVKAILQV